MFHIIGVGAIGSTIATNFYKNNIQTTIVLKNSTQLANYSGIIIKNDPIKFLIPAIDIDHIIDINHINIAIKYAIICVKIYDVIGVLTKIDPYLGIDHIIILVCNGIGILDQICDIFPHMRIMFCVCCISAQIDNNNNNNNNNDDNMIDYKIFKQSYIGASIGSFSTDEISFINQTMEQSKLQIVWTDDIQLEIKKKFTYNCCLNILAAVYMCTCRQLLSDHKPMLNMLCVENAKIMSVYGLDITADYLYEFCVKVLDQIGDNYLSIYRDMMQNKQTELAYLNGQMIKLANEKDISADINLELLNLI